MQSSKYSVTFACYNQVDYTRKCIESMTRHGDDLSRLVVIDNGSTDHTRDYLQTLPLGDLILNHSNLGCGVAWNQGILALQTEWTIIMNNDVIVSPNWIENLIYTAEDNNLKIISPALIEGPLDYDFDTFATNSSHKMGNHLRFGNSHAVCLAVHESVWHDIGFFQPIPKLLGYEDAIFFGEATKAKIPMGMTGKSWLHHYGSITQSAMKQERGIANNKDLDHPGITTNYKKGWLQRKLTKLKRKHQQSQWRKHELNQFGISMHGERTSNSFIWK